MRATDIKVLQRRDEAARKSRGDDRVRNADAGAG
jgi:hypothetical protein